MHQRVAAVAVLGSALLFCPLRAGAQTGYQQPAKSILDILHAPAAPQVSINPTCDHLLLVQSERYPPIAELAQPMLRLAGLRINPNTNGPHVSATVAGLTLQSIETGKVVKLELPGGRCGHPVWAPDGLSFAFSTTTANGIELWVGATATGTVRRIPGIALNTVHDAAIDWLPGSKELICRMVPADRGPPPAAPQVPRTPVIQESTGKTSPVRTFQDLLQNGHDEDLFDYYATSQLVLIDVQSGMRTTLGKPAIFSGVDAAPDGKHVLVTRIHRPYSYLLPASAFPREIEVWNRAGEVVVKVASLPLADQVPIEGVPTGPREVRWVPTEPATLVWAEALDGGDPARQVPHRDELKLLRVGQDRPTTLTKTEQRYFGLTFGDQGGIMLLVDYERDRRHRRTFILDAADRAVPPRLLWDLSINERYRHPGTPMRRILPTGHAVLQQNDGKIFLSGSGASPTGDRPFLDRLDLKTGKTERLFQCAEDSYEEPVVLLAADGSRFLTRHESPTGPPNYRIRTSSGEMQPLTKFTDPTPQLRRIKQQLVRYQRADGVPLSMTLYLPADYQEGQRLPAVVWAYPREFNDPDTAGQVVGSPQRFMTIQGPSHLYFLTQGYAVLDGATMPVVGPPDRANDTYVEQIVASAKAAIDKADQMGVIDRKRVGVGGHSYGAFMTANLLAHSDLFQAGIARSGAYNRTLTPFGFQAERRTLWEASETYLKMSPFMHVPQIRQPILLIHGEADNNAGTYPIQSERLYQALKGNGGTVRYVTLPHESHGYLARESIEHTLFEMVAWFDRHVKNW